MNRREVRCQAAAPRRSPREPGARFERNRAATQPMPRWRVEPACDSFGHQQQRRACSNPRRECSPRPLTESGARTASASHTGPGAVGSTGSSACWYRCAGIGATSATGKETCAPKTWCRSVFTRRVSRSPLSPPRWKPLANGVPVRPIPAFPRRHDAGRPRSRLAGSAASRLPRRCGSAPAARVAAPPHGGNLLRSHFYTAPRWPQSRTTTMTRRLPCSPITAN